MSATTIPKIVVMSNSVSEALYVNGELKKISYGTLNSEDILEALGEEYYEGSSQEMRWPKHLDCLPYW